MMFIIRILFLLSIPMMSFSDIHNFTINVGGTFSYDMIDDNGSMPSLLISPNTMDSFLGGGFDFSLGYLYLYEKYIIQGFDTRVSFGMNFNSLCRVDGRIAILGDGVENSMRAMYFNAGTTYYIGRELNFGRILIDIVGVNIGYLCTKEIRENSSKKEIIYSGGIFTLSANLPMGIQYIFDNGIMLGFKHRLNFAFSGTPTIQSTTSNNVTEYEPTTGGLYGIGSSQSKYLSYNLTFGVGYVFGLK